MEDKQIVELYFARAESAVAETEKKYGRYCRYIAYRILENDEDAEESVNDTYLKAWNTMPPHRPQALKPYLGMLCRQISLDRYEMNHAGKRFGQVSLALEELAECIPDGKNGDPGEGLALRDALNRFLYSLPEKTRKIFLRRYWYTSSIAEIASDFGMKESNVTVLLLRTRRKLKAFLQKEGFFV
ncbi:MAG: sigma-70 family RNA polymerase sigma factor [Ruminococcaceae bacterium]|nr:sigma-70 family RNA polymerase sigma factor [Oscillospiraceae bacterium]